MRLIKTIFLSIIFLLLISSCDKEEGQQEAVMAGITNSNMLFHNYSPPLQIQLQTDSLTEIKSGLDSVDLDLDGSFDIIISHKIPLDGNDDFDRFNFEEDNFPFIGLKTKNEFDVAYKSIEVNVGQGYFNSMSLVDDLSYEFRVDKIKKWHSSNVSYFGINNGHIWLWGAPPLLFWSYGPWYSLSNSEVYIGIRKKHDNEFKLGWIKMKVFSKGKYEIISHAIQK
ncbi:hypothetical protein [uncultured Draconibacterium sp.]|uniref:hypothetical protein n=1 Tax=uncultured Draconibacterium sp. TaxID=1573823 RepID=UPI002AA8C188|nr:hypothetical protein [uncultured Draconibacterium sp.]